ncbi:hypothetical protein G9A89_001034 [Geosiphon pyriformis]|nr:hypothetical protein G9A89_001034 [Geosiphon pyriformis]
MDFWKLVLLSVQSSSLILFVSLAGYLCAKIGLINSKVQSGLSQLTVKLFMPCLLFAQVGASIDAETLIRLWPLPAFFALFCTLSIIAALIGGKIFGFTTSQTKFIATGIIFNNVTSRPIGLIQALATTEAIKLLLWGEKDTPPEAVARGISYALINTLMANVLRFSLGTWLLKKDEKQVGNLDQTHEEQGDSSSISDAINSSHPNEDLIYRETTTLLNHPQSKYENGFKKRAIEKIKSIQGFLNPPLYAALIAIFVGISPPLKELFFGTSFPLFSSLTRAIRYIGDMTIPMTLLMLGAQLNNLTPRKNRQSLPSIMYILLFRFILMPIIGIFLVVFLRSWYLNDPMLWFILMLEASGPSAITIMNMAQVTGAFQEEAATLLFYSYLVLAPFITVTMMCILTILGNITHNGSHQ